MTTATSKTDEVKPDGVKSEAGMATVTGKEKWLHAYRQMVSIRSFEEQVNELYTRALMPGLAHLYIGEEAVAVEFAKRFASTTTSPARIAATDIAWPRARRRTACSPSCWAKKRAIAGAKADRCTLPIRPPETWARTRLSAAAWASPRARLFRRRHLGNGSRGRLLLR